MTHLAPERNPARWLFTGLKRKDVLSVPASAVQTRGLGRLPESKPPGRWAPGSGRASFPSLVLSRGEPGVHVRREDGPDGPLAASGTGYGCPWPEGQGTRSLEAQLRTLRRGPGGGWGEGCGRGLAVPRPHPSLGGDPMARHLQTPLRTPLQPGLAKANSGQRAENGADMVNPWAF